LRSALNVIEADSGHGATVLCGDLDIDPHEASAAGRSTLNAKMTLRSATSADDLYAILQQAFSGRTVRAVIQSLLAQSAGAQGA
jgi:hypothetical protein